MFEFEFKTSAALKLAAALTPEVHRKSFRKAVRAEGFRGFKALKEQYRTGGGFAKRTRVASLAGRPKNRGRVAFKWASKFVAYSAKDNPGGSVEFAFGPTVASKFRGKSGDSVERAITNVLYGNTVRVDRRTQRIISWKIRTREARPDLVDKMVPRLGDHTTPKRDFMTPFWKNEIEAKSNKNIATLYERAMAGERWANTWWSN